MIYVSMTTLDYPFRMPLLMSPLKKHMLLSEKDDRDEGRAVIRARPLSAPYALFFNNTIQVRLALREPPSTALVPGRPATLQ